MRINISKMNKNNSSEIFFYQYNESKKMNALSIWKELMEPRFLLNKKGFLEAWKLFTGSKLDIVVNNSFQYEVLAEFLTNFNSSKLEYFLEKIWRGYSFIVYI
ncbi:MAG: hypothetical protein HUJ42_02415 [Malacoplasma sp.]|nr:hypothetical protein [Malacoplasma sp.]